MKRYKALDLYCCAGGASAGLAMAGFDVIGVDNTYHRNYPFPMLVTDALSIEDHIDLSTFDFIWASPPCQRFSWATPKRCRDKHPDIIEPTRQILARSGALTAMENVPNAPLRADIILDGVHFGLPLERRRIFEVNFKTDDLMVGPRSRPSAGRDIGRSSGPEIGPESQGQFGLPKAVSVTGGGGAGKGGMEEWEAAMGIDWMSRRELVQAVPPAYARAIGEQAMKTLDKRAAA